MRNGWYSWLVCRGQDQHAKEEVADVRVVDEMVVLPSGTSMLCGWRTDDLLLSMFVQYVDHDETHIGKTREISIQDWMTSEFSHARHFDFL